MNKYAVPVQVRTPFLLFRPDRYEWQCDTYDVIIETDLNLFEHGQEYAHHLLIGESLYHQHLHGTMLQYTENHVDVYYDSLQQVS